MWSRAWRPGWEERGGPRGLPVRWLRWNDGGQWAVLFQAEVRPGRGPLRPLNTDHDPVPEATPSGSLSTIVTGTTNHGTTLLGRLRCRVNLGRKSLVTGALPVFSYILNLSLVLKKSGKTTGTYSVAKLTPPPCFCLLLCMTFHGGREEKNKKKTTLSLKR